MNMTILDIFGEEKQVEGKICAYCNEYKMLSEFSYHSKSKHSGHRNQCKTCVSDHKKHTEQLRKDNPIPHNHKCPICNRDEKQLNLKNKRFVCDHNHTTKEFRGYICNDCNIALGIFEDEPERLIQALVYLLVNDRQRRKTSLWCRTKCKRNLYKYA